eukprot:4347206-Amphidinium_carterae.1
MNAQNFENGTVRGEMITYCIPKAFSRHGEEDTTSTRYSENIYVGNGFGNGYDTNSPRIYV